ncbi:type II toxin-antitoxin system PemI/MazE family antitoxin [Enterococcus rotai]|uniref:type II toxin-antitoxin system PemI/MazE family antitoxin n=1 Tax=Enterococcus rotai TaxID=118060 RepID=UPI0035C663ED
MKTRRQGNAIVLTIPAKFGIAENVEYIAVKGDDESISFIKKRPNLFKAALENNEVIEVGDGFPEDPPVGKELFQ